ncbi:MAG: efflux transporter outer membrane subunit, partial [Gammaproteobacteria bacterium]|nr:efflux transporter outer membrane subunit [Gammaproteobacteria bacterium]
GAAGVGAWTPARPADTAPRGPWWTRFGDPRLDRLEQRVGADNQDIRAALARLLRARADTRIARAGLWPRLGVAAAANRSRISTNSPRLPSTVKPIADNFDVEGDLSYELDLFGRIHSGVDAARAGEQAGAADLAALELAMRAEFAIDYFSLRGEDANIALLDSTVADDARSLALTQNLHRGGAAAAVDVSQARAQWEGARTAAAEARLQRALTLHALAVLAGANPTTFTLAADPLPVDSKPPAVNPGLPSTLLERRPDVAAAERRVAAANAQIGVARAAYFPVFDLAAAIGADSASASTWLAAPSRLWSLGATGVLTVFDAGLHRAQSAAAHARYEELVADYRNTVIGAYRDVEDDLAALAALDSEARSEAAAVDASATALSQARYRYQAGVATYLEVATAETAALQARSAAVAIATRRLAAGVRLIEALGGGWREVPAASQ